MTKSEMFATIKSLLSDNAEVVAFCDHEIDLLARKSSSTKPTKTQVENEGIKMAMLATMGEVDRPVTISELMEICPALVGIKNQRASALMTQLKNAHLIERTEVKGKAFFAIA